MSTLVLSVTAGLHSRRVTYGKRGLPQPHGAELSFRAGVLERISIATSASWTQAAVTIYRARSISSTARKLRAVYLTLTYPFHPFPASPPSARLSNPPCAVSCDPAGTSFPLTRFFNRPVGSQGKKTKKKTRSRRLFSLTFRPAACLTG